MELKIYNPSTEDGFLKQIEWNFDELKNELQEKTKDYATTVYTDDLIKEAKSDRAKLNKFITALEDKRKDVKKQCLKPYEDFEVKVKELVGIVNNAVCNIDGQVKGYEQKCRDEKKEKVMEIWSFLVSGELVNWLPAERFVKESYYNSSTTLKSIREEISALVEQTQSDLDTMRKADEYSFEMLEEYKVTHSLQKSLQLANELRAKAEAKRIYEEQKAKELEERKSKAEADAAMKLNANVTTEENKTVNQVQPATVEVVQPVINNTVTAEARQWISFRANLTVEDAKALKAFFDSRNITFQAV